MSCSNVPLVIHFPASIAIDEGRLQHGKLISQGQEIFAGCFVIALHAIPGTVLLLNTVIQYAFQGLRKNVERQVAITLEVAATITMRSRDLNIAREIKRGRRRMPWGWGSDSFTRYHFRAWRNIRTQSPRTINEINFWYVVAL